MVRRFLGPSPSFRSSSWMGSETRIQNHPSRRDGPVLTLWGPATSLCRCPQKVALNPHVPRQSGVWEAGPRPGPECPRRGPRDVGAPRASGGPWRLPTAPPAGGLRRTGVSGPRGATPGRVPGGRPPGVMTCVSLLQKGRTPREGGCRRRGASLGPRWGLRRRRGVQKRPAADGSEGWRPR